MSNLTNNELVFMKPTSDPGQALFKGSVKVNYPDLDLSHGVLLRSMPSVKYTNLGGQGHGSGFTGSSPTFTPLTVQILLDGSVMRAYEICATATALGEVMIYQLVASGNSLTILSTYTLEDTYIAGWSMHFDAPTDQETGDGIVATLSLVSTAITFAQTQFDPSGTPTGQSATKADTTKAASQMVGS